MSNDGTKRLTAILAVLMIVAIGGGTLAQLFSNNATTAEATAVSTPVPSPTFPTPLTDFSTISLADSYLHPSGLFSVAQPTGWTPASPVSNTSGAEITMNNPNLLSVIQDSLQVPSEPITSLDQLDALYTTATLNDSWSNYRRDTQTGLNYRETGRRRENDRLVLDFELQNNRQQVFLARQVAWTDGQWVYSVRVVTPENAIDMLKFLVDSIIPTFQGYTMFAGTPTDWQAYFDPIYNTIIRYPASWTVTDSAPGLPTTITGEDTVLRVESQPGTTVADEAAARAWVEASRPDLTILSVKPATHGDLAGFSVSYTFATPDGTPQSGAVVLLNGANNTLHVANLHFSAADVDLNADDAATGSYGDLVQVLGTLQVLQNLSVVLPTPTPSFTPPPATATLEVTATPTETETAAATFTSTPAPTDTATATIAATEEPTLEPTATFTAAPSATPTVRPTRTPTQAPTTESTAEATEGS